MGMCIDRLFVKLLSSYKYKSHPVKLFRLIPMYESKGDYTSIGNELKCG